MATDELNGLGRGAFTHKRLKPHAVPPGRDVKPDSKSGLVSFSEAFQCLGFLKQMLNPSIRLEICKIQSENGLKQLPRPKIKLLRCKGE
ncbi:hypothetical protein DRQ33_03555 [bacterium]|nr:MAG: hypothetical protein DRQ33_03555 [bacterium]